MMKPFLVSSMLSLSVRNSLNHFSKHLIRFPTIDGISFLWFCIQTICWHVRPFLNTRHIDFFGLNFIHAQEMLSSNDGTSHLNRIWAVVITVWSSMSSHQLSNMYSGIGQDIVLYWLIVWVFLTQNTPLYLSSINWYSSFPPD